MSFASIVGAISGFMYSKLLIVILLAGSAAGILGMLLAIPAYTVLRVFAKEFFSQFSLVRKLTKQI